MKCPNCGHHFTQERKPKSTYQERPGKLQRYASGYESHRAAWLAAQRKPVKGPRGVKVMTRYTGGDTHTGFHLVFNLPPAQPFPLQAFPE